MEKSLSRRNFLRFAGITVGTAALAACVPTPAPAPAGGEATAAP
ncbi:MAG: twin-arginine translocation signal domain-containing protein, partial [Anaerolineae bacterium]